MHWCWTLTERCSQKTGRNSLEGKEVIRNKSVSSIFHITSNYFDLFYCGGGDLLAPLSGFAITGLLFLGSRSRWNWRTDAAIYCHLCSLGMDLKGRKIFSRSKSWKMEDPHTGKLQNTTNIAVLWSKRGNECPESSKWAQPECCVLK